MSNKKRPRNPQLASSQPSKATPWIIALVVLLCIGGVVAVSLLNKGDSKGDDTAAGSPSSVAPTTETPTSGSPSSDDEPPLQCDDPPPLPADPKSFDKAPDPATAKGKTFVIDVTTNCGPITLELDGAAAPQTVASFVFLAKQGFYDDTPCHRLVVSGIYVLQCGDPTGQGDGGPGYSYGIENAPADGNYPRGTLAMARTNEPDSNGSQFFMVYADSTLPTDGGGYSVFGKVTNGLLILETIADEGVATSGQTDGAPKQPISILSMKVTEKK